MQYKIFIFAFAFFCCFAFTVATLAQKSQPSERKNQDGEQEIARKIQATLEKIHATRMERMRLQKEFQNQSQELDKQIERLNAELEKTETTVREETKRYDSLKLQIAHEKEIRQIAKDLLDQATELATRIIEEAKKRVAIGIPFQKQERVRQLARILDTIRNPNEKDRISAIGDCCQFFMEELRLGRTTVLWNEPVILENGGQQKHAYQVRMGLVNQFFISEDGQVVSLASNIAGQDWKIADSVQERQLRTILDILQRHRPPALISVPCPFIPIPIPAEKSGGKSK